jgi:hypothetical protein
LVDLFGANPPALASIPRHPVAVVRLALMASLAAGIGVARAQEPAAGPGAADNRPVIRAIYLPNGLTVDGKLDEPIYAEAPPITTWIQQEPHEGAPATEKTEAWVFFDDKNLYVSARMWDSHPERIVAKELRRDNGAVTQDESFSVVLDTFHDQRSGFTFIVNPLGGMMDGAFTNEKEYNGNFDPVWNPRAGRFDQGWTVEIEIPLKSLRYPSSGEQVWGLQLRRVVRWKNEVVHLTRIPASYGLFGMVKVTSEATLVGLRTPAASKNLELKPYAVSRMITDRLASPPTAGHVTGDLGGDIKYGITRGVTADVTYNTDFAQVEDDQQQVNLTRFTLFYPEKREFFLEGQGVFNFGGGADTTELPVLFFSRRIGLENGQAVPIRAGGRVTGKAGKYTLGALDIVTEDSSAANTPATSFRVFRLKRDIHERGSIGVLATERAPSGGRESFAYGADANIGFGLTTINAYYARTHTPGQSGRTASYYGQVEYNADRYGVIAEHLTVEPQFTPDVGFLRRTDFRKEYGLLRYSPRPKGLPGIRKLYFESSLKYITDASDHLQSRAAIGDVRGDVENGDAFAAYYERDYEFLPRPFALRPTVVVPVGGYPFYNWTGSYTLGPVHAVRGTLSVSTGTFYNGTRRSFSYSSGRLEIGSHVALEPTISENWVDLPWGRFRADLVSTRTTYSFSPRADLAALVQYNSSTNALSSNVRFRWQYVPGSDLFVVYNDARNTLVPDHFAELQSRTLVVKITRLFRF